jgi:hypothetical protein
MVRALVMLSVAALSLAGTASARTVHYNNVISPTKLISCFAVQHSAEIECTAPYLPDIGEFDTYLGLKPRGRAKLAQRSDYPGFTTRRHTLRYGDVWSRPGIRCVMRRRGLGCRNRSRHGFHIQKGHVRRF